jgi:hypothetical protein
MADIEELRLTAATSRSQWPPTHRFRTGFRRQEPNPNSPKIAQRLLQPFAAHLRSPQTLHVIRQPCIQFLPMAPFASARSAFSAQA